MTRVSSLSSIARSSHELRDDEKDEEGKRLEGTSRRKEEKSKSSRLAEDSEEEGCFEGEEEWPLVVMKSDEIGKRWSRDQEKEVCSNTDT